MFPETPISPYYLFAVREPPGPRFGLLLVPDVVILKFAESLFSSPRRRPGSIAAIDTGLRRYGTGPQFNDANFLESLSDEADGSGRARGFPNAGRI
jgi:hypothetical protein